MLLTITLNAILMPLKISYIKHNIHSFVLWIHFFVRSIIFHVYNMKCPFGVNQMSELSQSKKRLIQSLLIKTMLKRAACANHDRKWICSGSFNAEINVKVWKFPCERLFLAQLSTAARRCGRKSRENLISQDERAKSDAMNSEEWGVKMFQSIISQLSDNAASNHKRTVDNSISGKRKKTESIFPLCRLLLSNYNGNFLRDYHWVSVVPFSVARRLPPPLQSDIHLSLLTV